MGVKVETIRFKGQDERGLTGEIDALGRSGKFILAYRKSGSISGNHYHKGFAAEKDPEIVFLLQGKVRLHHARVVDGGKVGESSEEVIAPSRIEIPKMVWHQLNTLEDCCFLELNSFEQGDSDTFRL